LPRVRGDCERAAILRLLPWGGDRQPRDRARRVYREMPAPGAAPFPTRFGAV